MVRRARTISKSKELAQQFLADVPGDNVFWCNDGREFHNLSELAEALTNMNDETFAYHANSYKNDFSRWVRDVIGDEELATALDKASVRSAAAKAVIARITALKKA